MAAVSSRPTARTLPSLKAIANPPPPAPLAVTRPRRSAPGRNSLPAPARKSSQQPSRAGKKVVSVYLTETVWRDLKLLAVKTDSTIDALVRQGIDRIFAEHNVNRGASEG
jgi:hypothetical protein